MLEDREQIRRNVQEVRGRIAGAATRSGRDPDTVVLVAVTKTVGIERIRWAVEAGVVAFGENYVQDLRRKQEEARRRLLALHRHTAVEHRAPGRGSRRRRGDGGRGAGCPTPGRSRRSVRADDRRVDRGRPDGGSCGGSTRRSRRVRRSGRIAPGTPADRTDDRAADPARSGRLPPLVRTAPRAAGGASGTAPRCAGNVDGDVVGLRGRGGRRRYDGPHRDRAVRTPSNRHETRNEPRNEPTNGPMNEEESA